MQAEIFPDFQALRSSSHLGAETPGRLFTEARAIGGPVLPARCAEDDETVGMRLLEFLQPRIENMLPPAAIEINIDAHICLIHAGDQRFDRLFTPVPAEFAKMVVRVNDGKGRPLDCGFLAHQSGNRPKG